MIYNYILQYQTDNCKY